jgi:hypothetical protein
MRRVVLFRLAVAKAVAVACAIAMLPLSAGCTCSRGGPPPQAGADFGDTSAPGPGAAGVAPYLAMARAILEGKGRSAVPAPPEAPGRRVMLALFRPGAASSPSAATAKGATLADAVAAAAQALAVHVTPEEMQRRGGDSRLELDLPTRLDGLGDSTIDQDIEEPLASIGLDGVLVTRDDGKTGFVLPGEIIERGLFHQGKVPGLEHHKVTTLLAERAGVSETDLGSMRAYRFRADAYVETPRHDSALPVVRGMVERPAQVTPDLLVAAVRRGADYLVRIMSPEGRYVYMYHPVDDVDDRSYGWLRHAGTTYALFEAYEELGTPAYADKGDLALRYLESHLRDDPSGRGKYLLDTNDEEEQKVGGAGLALLAFAKQAAVTGRRDHLETMRALARFIIEQQYADGHFRSNADVEHETGRKLKREPIYYTGEATLALLRLYAVDPQQAYVDAARKAVDWVIHVRDAYVSEDNQEHDHWISYALNDLFRVVHDGAYVEHAYKIARAIRSKEHVLPDAPAPDWAGTFYDGQTTPGSTRLEAFDADIALSRFAGKPDDWLLGPAKDVARATLGQQFTPDDDYWLKNPAKAEGGVRESLYVNDVRIDYVQHSMSAWLHLARILRDPSYGKTGVPSQDPVRPAVDEGATAQHGR